MITTVFKARNSLSDLLRRVEQGEEVIIRRGAKGPAFRIVRQDLPARRTLKPNPAWKGRIRYSDADIWASEWTGDE